MAIHIPITTHIIIIPIILIHRVTTTILLMSMDSIPLGTLMAGGGAAISEAWAQGAGTATDLRQPPGIIQLTKISLKE
jgi:hypothetical protein